MPTTIRRRCDVCSTPYEAKRRTSKYCSERCRKRAQRVGLVVVDDTTNDPRRPLAQELLQLTVAHEPVPITAGMVGALLIVLDMLDQDEIDGLFEAVLHVGRLIQGYGE